jgi:hypothetical protein
LSITHEDQFTENMAQRLLAIQEAHSDLKNRVLIDGDGVRELEEILTELQKMTAVEQQGPPD